MSFWSCSGHGGYVVDVKLLTDDERKRLRTMFATLRPSVQDRINAGGSLVWYFEEDCEWAVLEACTSIRIIDQPDDIDLRDKMLSHLRSDNEHRNAA